VWRCLIIPPEEQSVVHLKLGFLEFGSFKRSTMRFRSSGWNLLKKIRFDASSSGLMSCTDRFPARL